MKSTGITRSIDELGRIVIPSELRKNLNLKDKDAMEIFTEGEQIIIRKYKNEKACMVTGEIKEDNISLYDGKLVLSNEGAAQLIKKLEEKLS